jgi:hypothetical protein
MKMMEKAIEAARNVIGTLDDKHEAVQLLEEWLLFAEGVLDARQARWLIERTNTFIGMI